MSILIETARLQLRHFTLADIDAVYQFSTCPDTTRYTGDQGVVQSKADAKKIIQQIWQAEYQRYGYARYAVVHKQDQQVIGFCGIKFEPSLAATDLGYRLLPKYWQQGLAYEACSALLVYVKQQFALPKIVAEVVVDNHASIKLINKLGFRQLDRYRKDGFMLNYYELDLND